MNDLRSRVFEVVVADFMQKAEGSAAICTPFRLLFAYSRFVRLLFFAPITITTRRVAPLTASMVSHSARWVLSPVCGVSGCGVGRLPYT